MKLWHGQCNTGVANLTSRQENFAALAIRTAQGASVVVAAVAITTFIGWLLNVPSLISLGLPGPVLKTNTCLVLACVAIANFLLVSKSARPWTISAQVLAGLATVVGGLTLLQHLFGVDFGIDQLIAVEPAGAIATTSPNRMGPPASTASTLLGLTLLLRSTPSRRNRLASHALAFATCVIALLPLIGYAYGFTDLYLVARYTGIALVTAAALFLLGIAVQAGLPDAGLTALLCRRDEAGVFARRMLPAAVLLPFGIGWLIVRVFGAGTIDAPFAISLMSLALVILLATAIWRTGSLLVHSLDARAATERALEESERTLRDSDRQKTEFLATLSHELRNPLAPIRFAVELLNGPPATADRARQTIARQVRHLARLIDDLLDLTRITRNKLELQIRSCEIRQLVIDAVDGVRDEVAGARHDLTIDLPQQPVWVRVDPDRIVQLLVNLLTNACRYTDPGGRIHLKLSVEAADVAISVRDSGQGIEQDDLGRVFERFVQVGKSRHGGLGIGLALVKALAELHGGQIEAFSAGSGQGAEFRLTLARTIAPPLETEATAAAGAPLCRILVVDDNRDAADMLARLLSLDGHNVQVAYDGEHALRLADTFRPQVALLDIGMDGMDGYQLARRFRGDPRLAQLFLVAITGWGQEEDRRQALASGFDAHITKPAAPEAIYALLSARFGRFDDSPAARRAGRP
jgi:signal transduction histidine kinase/CheY-like chemotaxis protein